MVIKSIKLNDFLMENGIYPEYENSGLSFYRDSVKLFNLLDDYAIKKAFNNRNGTD
jgi:hypothetical protein